MNYTHILCRYMRGSGSRRGVHNAAEYASFPAVHAGNYADFVGKSKWMAKRGIKSLCGKLHLPAAGEEDGRGTARVGTDSANIIGPEVTCAKCLTMIRGEQ